MRSRQRPEARFSAVLRDARNKPRSEADEQHLGLGFERWMDHIIEDNQVKNMRRC
jgi:hypothetical protein